MAKFLDNILCTIMVFLLTFAWTVYSLKNVQLALLLSTIVAACACYLIFVTLSKWDSKQKSKQKHKKLMKDFSTFLQFNADNGALFSTLFQFYGFQVEQQNFDSLVAQKHVAETNKPQRTFAAFCLQTDNLSFAQIQNAVVSAKRNNCTKLLIFCHKTDNSLLQIANSQMPTKFVDIANIYTLSEQAEKLPQIPSVKTPKQRVLPQYVFNKKRFGWFLGGAFFTLVTASFSLFKTYLLVWSTLLFAIALFCLFNTKYNKAPTNTSLD